MRRLAITLAAMAAVLIAFSAPAAAAGRHHKPTAQAGSYIPNNDGKWSFVQPTDRSYKSPRAGRPGHGYRAAVARERRKAAEARKASPGPRQGVLVDKAQEYFKPTSPTEKLVTREAHERAVAGLLRNGMVRVKTAQGFYITVNPLDASKFLKFFALLKEHGDKINPAIVGCYSPGGHKPGSNHHIGRACDVQTGWNRGPAFVYHMSDIVRRAGLYDGCSFGDCGHVEAVRGLFNKRPNLYASVTKFKSDQSTENYQP